MRFSITLLLLATALIVSGCASQGPGATCDATAAEANPVGAGSQAAASAASGGQRTSNAPFAEDTARLSPQTTVGRGQGATTSNSADDETRHVASGGAQNLGVVIPTQANANTTGGTSPAIYEAAKNVQTFRTLLTIEVSKPTPNDARIEFLSGQLASAQVALSQAQSAATVTHTTHNNFQQASVQQFGISTSATGKEKAIDPEVVGPMAEAAARVSNAGFPAPADAAPPTGELPPSPPPEEAPAPPPVDDPPAGDGN